ncbi:MAG: hypothetical protein P3B98_03015 [Gemmatimonadota bacterium]|nr:hypothetical protein [Gemmatimonadota bacterium]
MATGRKNKLTGQIAEHLVCAELGRIDLIATPFAGNVPTLDVIAADEACHTVPIQVKAATGESCPSAARRWMRLDLDMDSGVQRYGGPLELADGRDWWRMSSTSVGTSGWMPKSRSTVVRNCRILGAARTRAVEHRAPYGATALAFADGERLRCGRDRESSEQSGGREGTD